MSHPEHLAMDYVHTLMPERKALLETLVPDARMHLRSGVQDTAYVELDRPYGTYSRDEHLALQFVRSPQTPVDFGAVSALFAQKMLPVHQRFWTEILASMGVMVSND